MVTLNRPALALILLAVTTSPPPQTHVPPPRRSAPSSFLGFDTNLYPGDQSLDALRKTFAFSGYWLNAPPGIKTTNWLGKRKLIRSKGFGFLVLFNGRRYSELKPKGDAGRIGKAEGAEAVKLARNEGFPPRTIIFLDQEEGGRLLAEQKAYVHAWLDAVAEGGYRAGVYCSGIAHHEGWSGTDVVTALDIRDNAGRRDITYFVSNDQCPPSPGCVRPSSPPAPTASGIAFAEIWQFAQSPRRKQLTSSCASTYAENGNCYAPADGNILIDLDVATSADPSHGR